MRNFGRPVSGILYTQGGRQFISTGLPIKGLFSLARRQSASNKEEPTTERAAMQTAQKEKTVKNLTRQDSGAFGNAATRIEAFMYSQGAQSFLRDPDMDAWYTQQLTERDPQKRQAVLHKIQRKAYDEARFMPI